HCLFEHFEIKIEPDGVQVPVLLGTQQVSRTAELQVKRREAEPGAQVGKLLQCRQTPLGNGGECFLGRNQEVGVGSPVRAAHTPAQLIKVGQPEALAVIHNQ